MSATGAVARKRITIVTPAFNEQDCVDELARRLSAVFDQLSAYDCEAIIVENGSSDGTYERLLALNARDRRFKVVQLARNFRMDGGLTAGLSEAKGDAVVLMTADLQDPPELIPEFVKRWEEGYENIYMVVTRRQGTGWLRRMNSRIFYWVIGKLTGNLVPQNASDFRLLDRRAYEAVRSMHERNRFVRGLSAWVGFRSIGVEAERQERFAGESKAYSFQVVNLALKGILAHSVLPLMVIPVVGIGLSILSAGAIGVLAIDWIVNGVPFPGFGTIVALMLLLFGIMFCLLGVVSLYVGLVYEEVKQRPNFIVRATVGLDDAPPMPSSDNGRVPWPVEAGVADPPAKVPPPGHPERPVPLSHLGRRS